MKALFIYVSAINNTEISTSEGPHRKISKGLKPAMERSQIYRRSERSKRIDVSSHGIPSRKQPLRFRVDKRCPIKSISFFGIRFHLHHLCFSLLSIVCTKEIVLVSLIAQF